MIPYLAHKEQLQKLMKDTSTETAEDILLYTNIAIREIAADHFYETLKRNVTFTTLLPGDLERPFYMQLSDTDYLAFPISETGRYRSSKLYNWWSNRVDTTPELEANDGAITANAKALTSAGAGFTAAMVGEYVRIGSNLGIYKIAAYVSATEVTLEDAYRGATVTGAHFEVRPWGTQTMAVTDEQGTVATPTGATLIYQKIPLPVYNDYDLIPLPGNCAAVMIMVHQQLLLGEKYDNDALKREAKYVKAIADMKPLAPTRGRTPRPRGRSGVPIVYGRSRSGRSSVDSNNRRILGT